MYLRFAFDTAASNDYLAPRARRNTTVRSIRRRTLATQSSLLRFSRGLVSEKRRPADRSLREEKTYLAPTNPTDRVECNYCRAITFHDYVHGVWICLTCGRQYGAVPAQAAPRTEYCAFCSNTVGMTVHLKQGHICCDYCFRKGQRQGHGLLWWLMMDWIFGGPTVPILFDIDERIRDLNDELRNLNSKIRRR